MALEEMSWCAEGKKQNPSSSVFLITRSADLFSFVLSGLFTRYGPDGVSSAKSMVFSSVFFDDDPSCPAIEHSNHRRIFSTNSIPQPQGLVSVDSDRCRRKRGKKWTLAKCRCQQQYVLIVRFGVAFAFGGGCFCGQLWCHLKVRTY